MDEAVKKFLEQHHSAIMTTLRPSGAPHVARVGVGLVDDRLWSSGTQTRLRTKHLRKDPRGALCVLNDRNPYNWLGIEAEVRILDGDDAPRRNLALYRAIRGEDPDDVDEYLDAMVREKRLIYEFEIVRTYGLL